MKVSNRFTQYYIEKKCEVCFTTHGEQSIVLCDRCDDAYHIHCIVEVCDYIESAIKRGA
jgi:hypothetical protein